MALTKAHKNNVRLALATGATFAMLIGAQALITLDASAEAPTTPDIVIATDIPTVTPLLTATSLQSKPATVQPAATLVQGSATPLRAQATTTALSVMPVVTAVPIKSTATKAQPTATQIQPAAAQPQPTTRPSRKKK